MTLSAKSVIESERGSVALISCLVISMLLIGVIIFFCRTTRIQSDSVVGQSASQGALTLADSGVSVARKALTDPRIFAQTTKPPPIQSSGLDYGRFEVALIRDPTNSSLVDLYSTGYYYLPRGLTLDPSNQRPAKMSVVHSKIRIDRVNEYFAAVPGSLTIAAGSDVSLGNIYAQDILFETISGAPRTKIGAAYYTGTVTRTDTGAEDPAPDFVDFSQLPAQAQRMATSPSLTTLDANVRALYSQLADTHALVPLPDFSGPVGNPLGSPPYVYFTDHDVDIGSNSPLVVSGTYVIYATGQIRIHNSISLANPGSTAQNWIALLAEQDIVVDSGAPPDLAIVGNYVTNGVLTTDGPAGSKNNLSFTGGVLAHQGIKLSRVYAGRSYAYESGADAQLFLPNFTTILLYEVLKGRY